MNKNLLITIATTVALISASLAAHAEQLSLDCVLTGNQGVLTFVIDTDKSTAENIPAIIDDQKIAWNDGQWRNLIDRRTGILTSSEMADKSRVAKANCSKSVAYRPGSNPMGELAIRSSNEFLATTKHCDKFPRNSQQKTLCLNKIAQRWLRERGKEYEHIPASYITGNDLARTFVEKTK